MTRETTALRVCRPGRHTLTAPTRGPARLDVARAGHEHLQRRDRRFACLALVEATFQPAPHGKERVCDELYAEVAQHYDEKAPATVTITIGQIGFFIALAVIGKPQPAGALANEQYRLPDPSVRQLELEPSRPPATPAAPDRVS